MIEVFAIFSFYLLPIYCIVFSLTLVSLLKKIKYEESTTNNTVWLTVSFVLIIMTIASLTTLD